MSSCVWEQQGSVAFEETDNTAAVIDVIRQHRHVWLLFSGVGMFPSIKTGDRVLVEGISADDARKGDVLLACFPQQRTLKLFRFTSIRKNIFILETDQPNPLGVFCVRAENIIGRVVRNECAHRNMWLSRSLWRFYYFACRRKPSSEARAYGGPAALFILFFNAFKSFRKILFKKKKESVDQAGIQEKFFSQGDDFRAFYRIADITFCLETGHPFAAIKRNANVERFRAKFTTSDRVYLRYHSGFLPCEEPNDYFCEESLWRIARQRDGGYLLEMYPSVKKKESTKQLAAHISKDYSTVDIYIDKNYNFLGSNNYIQSLTFFTTDQILLALLLSSRDGIIVHGCGIVINGKGYIFVGHAGAGKTTLAKMFLDRAIILCDDRVVVRKIGEKFLLYGTWFHGDLPFVSPETTMLGGIFFIHQSAENRIVPCQAKDACVQIYARRVFSIIEKEAQGKAFDFCNELAVKVPCFDFYFKKDETAADFLENALSDMPFNSAGIF